MAIDLLREDAVSLNEARRKLIPPINGKPISSPTVYRWVNRGVLAGDGVKVKLEAVRIGRELVTTREAVARFLKELTARSGYDMPPDDGNELPVETEHKLKAAGLL